MRRGDRGDEEGWEAFAESAVDRLWRRMCDVTGRPQSSATFRTASLNPRGGRSSMVNIRPPIPSAPRRRSPIRVCSDDVGGGNDSREGSMDRRRPAKEMWEMLFSEQFLLRRLQGDEGGITMMMHRLRRRCPVLRMRCHGHLVLRLVLD